METRHCKITFWDLGGQEGLRTLRERYFPDADAIIYEVDTGDAERLYEAKAAFEHVMHNKKLDGLPVLVVANKQDLPHTQNITTIFDPATQPSLHPFRIQAVCALTGYAAQDRLGRHRDANRALSLLPARALRRASNGWSVASSLANTSDDDRYYRLCRKSRR